MISNRFDTTVVLVDFRCWAKTLEQMTELKGVFGVLLDPCLSCL